MSSWIGKTRQLGAQLFFSFTTRTAHWRTESSCITRRCGANRKKIREIKFGNYEHSKFVPSCLLAQGVLLRQYIGAGIPIFRFRFPYYCNIQNGGEQFAAICLFMGTSPKNCGLLGGNRNTLKLKTTAKLKDKRTSIATVRGPYRMYATLPTPFGSHYRLPLMYDSIGGVFLNYLSILFACINSQVLSSIYLQWCCCYCVFVLFVNCKKNKWVWKWK